MTTQQYAGASPKEMDPTTTLAVVEGRRRGRKGPTVRSRVSYDPKRVARVITELIGTGDYRSQDLENVRYGTSDTRPVNLGDLAASIGVSPRTIHRLMAGDSKTTNYYILDALATACCVHVSYLEVA